ncbi:MAG: methyltransferase domain-containing protein [Terriglobales bacterium]
MRTWTTCRVCDTATQPILSLGDQYVSNFISPDEPDGMQAPLELVLCSRCRLLQLKHTVPGDAMYKNYWYRSGTNQTMTSALADIATRAEQLMHLQRGDSVLDIGCNDGTLLKSYATAGLYKIGFDPAENLAVYSRKVADQVLVGFFDAARFLGDPALQSRRPKVVTSIAMFYDLEEPRKFVAGIKKVLHPEGLWIIQMSYLPLMLEQNDFGNICHEHLEYYSLQSLEYLLGLHYFEVADVELNDVNGGSYRVYIRNRGADPALVGDDAYRRDAGARLAALRRKESDLKLETAQPYRDFAARVGRIKQETSTFIREQVARKKVVYVYGASTKGNTMLQYFGLDQSVIRAAAERNPDKWGKVTVGTRIPIVSEAEARSAKPDYFLVLPWHFIREFTEREKDYLSSTGSFIVPLPRFEVIGSAACSSASSSSSR